MLSISILAAFLFLKMGKNFNAIAGGLKNINDAEQQTKKNHVVQQETPYERCRRRLDANFDPTSETYLHFPKGKDYNISLQDAMTSNETTIYFLHQRKAGGSTIRTILYNMYKRDVTNEQKQTRNPFVACFSRPCTTFELPLYEANYLGSVKVVGAHMSYHVPFARASYEDQVLITNFREPISRIKSCMVYRYPDAVKEVFGSPNYTHAKGEELLLNRKDSYRSTCIQEPVRILSPFDPDKEPLSRKDMEKICCMVRELYHVIWTPPPPPVDSLHTNTSTLIEREIMDIMRNTKENVNRVSLSTQVQSNLNEFLDYIRPHPMVKSEIDLYNCVRGP